MRGWGGARSGRGGEGNMKKTGIKLAEGIVKQEKWREENRYEKMV